MPVNEFKIISQMVDKVSYSIQHIGLNLSTTLFHSSGKSLFIFRTTSLICTCVGYRLQEEGTYIKIVIIMTYVVRGLLTIFNILQSLTTLSQGQLAPHLGTQTASLADFFTSEPVLSHSPRPTMQSTTASTWRGLSGAEETGVDAIWSHCRSRHGSQQQFHTVLHLSGNYTSLH